VQVLIIEKNESTAQSTDSAKAYRKPRAFIYSQLMSCLSICQNLRRIRQDAQVLKIDASPVL